MNSECSICFEIVRTEPQKPLVTPCGHLFHDNCISSCLPDRGTGKCPQCNQPIKISNLIRLYVNEPENSIRAKDELIEQLRSQLKELNEKAQLQYNLILSLNRQIDLMRELSGRGKRDGYSDSNTGNAMSQRSIVAPAKLNLPRRVLKGTRQSQGAAGFTDSTVTQPISQGFAFGSSSDTRRVQGAANFNFPTFDQPTLQGLSIGTNSGTRQFETTNFNAPTVKQSIPKGFVFGSRCEDLFNPIASNVFAKNYDEFDSSAAAGGNIFMFGRDATNNTKSAGQNANLFVPTTNIPKKKPIFAFTSSIDELGLDTWLKSRSKIAIEEEAGAEGSTCSNVFAKFKSKSKSGEKAESQDRDWSFPVFSAVSDEKEDNVVQDAIVVDDPSESVSVADDVVGIVPVKEES
ncbi:hypothetical protein HA402_009795 [Bradysia odoriphaga]|nr:hypothetical protein HA402_009795 [Bradysia odoriphaga]